MPEQTTPTSRAAQRPGVAPDASRPTSTRPSRAAATDARLTRAAELIRDRACSVLSLDVFDTLLWRKVPEPIDAFLPLGTQLVTDGLLSPDIDAGAFASLRRRAEVRARQDRESSGRGVEVTLGEICARIPREILRGIGPDELAAREVELERSLLVPDLDVAELVRAAAENAIPVICVSDTYFSEGDLRLFLATPPLGALAFDRVFASSAHGVGKTGGLWRIVLDELGVRPKEVVHVGDNHPADVVAAGRAGLTTVYFERRPDELNRTLQREARYLRHAPLSAYHGDYGLTALRSKVLHRTEHAHQPAELKPYWTFGAACLGPPLAGFAEWVHERAHDAGASKVFCMMREGELLSRMIRMAAPAARHPVESEPIWLSRQVCARATIVSGTAAELSSLLQRRRMPTAGELCRTLGLDVEDVPGFERRPEARLDEPYVAEKLIGTLSSDPDLRASIVSASAELRSRIVRYVEGLRPPGEERVVLVDLGWGATIQFLLEGVLRAAGSDVQTLGLYLITTDRAAERMLDGLALHGFLGSAGQPAGDIEAFMRSPEILEQICMPDHGSQVGFDESLRPVLGPTDEPPMQAAQRESVQKGIASFQREWVRYRTSTPTALVPLYEDGQPRLRMMLVRALMAPTATEAGLFGGWLHDENFGSEGSEPIVTAGSARTVRYLEPREALSSSMTDLYWPFGLAAIHDEHLASAVEATVLGVVDWEGFSSPLETGEVEIFCDRGWGFRRDGMVRAQARRNRLGLSYARGTVVGDVVRAVRIDPARGPCVVRIDWLRLRCHRRSASSPTVIDLDGQRQLDRLRLRGMRAIAPGCFLVTGSDPNMEADLRKLVGDDVHTVDVELGFALVALPPSGLRRRASALRASLRDRAKRGRLGAPLRLVYRLLRKVD